MLFMQVRLFFYSILKFWYNTCFSTGNHRKVINTQTGQIFWPNLYNNHINANCSQSVPV